MTGQETTFGEGRAMALFGTTPPPLGLPWLRCAVAARPVAAQVARHLVRDCLTGWLSAEVIADVGLVATELVANAVAAAGDSGVVEFAAGLAGSEVVVHVIDQAGGIPSKQVHDDYAEGGRGLLLVEELTRAWGWIPLREGKLVWGTVGTTRHTTRSDLPGGFRPPTTPAVESSGAG